VPILHAVVLGITQGLSEFLPISSSGHLILVPWLFRWNDFAGAGGADLNKTFDVALHLGTFAGAVVYFRRDLAIFARAGLRSIRDRAVEGDAARMAWLLVISAVPGALVGALFESTINDSLGKPWLIGAMLVVFGLVLVAADRLGGHREANDFRLRDALTMGVAQAVALQPGVSRSGVTITAARWLHFDRDAAARLSFQMSLPIIGGAGAYKGFEVMRGGGIPSGFGAAFAWGTVASAVTGFAAVWGLLRVVRTRSFAPFVAYRVLAGVAVLGLLATNLR
jgi:undecaprenyl-diphosphatase